MTALSPAQAARIVKIAARIDSPHDGEVLNAVRLLLKQLGGHGLRISEVIERGVSGGNRGHLFAPVHSPHRPSPPAPTHRTKIDALLADPAFMGEYLTRRSLVRLRSLRVAQCVDTITMAWIDGLLLKARQMQEGRTA